MVISKNGCNIHAHTIEITKQLYKYDKYIDKDCNAAKRLSISCPPKLLIINTRTKT